VISAWPTVAFPGMVEMGMQFVRRSRTRHAMATEPVSMASVEVATSLSPRDAELIAAGIRIRKQAERDGVLLSRKAFADKVREDGYTIANGRISWLRAACGFPSSNACPGAACRQHDGRVEVGNEHARQGLAEVRPALQNPATAMLPPVIGRFSLSAAGSSPGWRPPGLA
jgi:hypothetical protein